MGGMGWWTERVVPRLADKTLDNAYMARRRAEVCAGLSGSVLEIGFGSGLNVPHYPPSVQSVTAIEPSDLAWSRAADRVAARRITVHRGGLDGARLDLGDDSIDSALSTFTLCTIPDVESALAEVSRVLRPGGTLHFLEHGVAPDESVHRWQARLEPMQRRMAGGCHLTRSPVELVAGSGLVVDHADQAYLPGPAVGRPWGFVYAGIARKSS